MCVGVCTTPPGEGANPLALDKRSAVLILILTLHASPFSTGRIRVSNSLFSTRASKSENNVRWRWVPPTPTRPSFTIRGSHMFSTTTAKDKSKDGERSPCLRVSAAFRKVARHTVPSSPPPSQFSQNTLDHRKRKLGTDFCDDSDGCGGW